MQVLSGTLQTSSVVTRAVVVATTMSDSDERWFGDVVDDEQRVLWNEEEQG